MKKKIHLEFADCPWQDKRQNPFFRLLERRYDVVLAEFPDYLIYTHAGHRHRLHHCTKIFYTQERYRPNWRECDFAVTSVCVDDPRAFHLPYYSLWTEPSGLIRSGETDWRGVLEAKTGFCSFLVGYDDRTVRHRSGFFRQLNARKRVDSGGRALNNLGRAVPPGREAKLEFLGRYKFHLAFENADVPGYTTEKLPDAFAAGTVPVYWGDITVKRQFNPEAFIDRRDFPSDEACIEHILRVDADDALYLRYLSAPPFRDNRPNKEWDHERLLDFLGGILERPTDPVSRRRWFYRLTKWRLAKRVKTSAEVKWV